MCDNVSRHVNHIDYQSLLNVNSEMSSKNYPKLSSFKTYMDSQIIYSCVSSVENFQLIYL